MLSLRSALFATLFLFFLAPPATAQGDWCWIYNCEEIEDQDELDELQEAFETYSKHEITLCGEVYEVIEDLLDGGRVWRADIPGTVGGSWYEWEDPAVIIDCPLLDGSELAALAQQLWHEGCHEHLKDSTAAYSQATCYGNQEECSPDGYSQTPSPTCAIPAPGPTSGPLALSPTVEDLLSFHRAPDQSRERVAVLQAVFKNLTRDWPADRIVIRSRPRVARAVDGLLKTVETFEGECDVLECVRAGKLVWEFLDLSVEGEKAIVHMAVLTLGIDFKDALQTWKVNLEWTDARGWHITTIEDLGIGI